MERICPGPQANGHLTLGCRDHWFQVTALWRAQGFGKAAGKTPEAQGASNGTPRLRHWGHSRGCGENRDTIGPGTQSPANAAQVLPVEQLKLREGQRP
jgi:hypothetical protein